MCITLNAPINTANNMCDWINCPHIKLASQRCGHYKTARPIWSLVQVNGLSRGVVSTHT